MPQLVSIFSFLIALVVGSIVFGYTVKGWMVGNENNQSSTTNLNQQEQIAA